MPRAGPAARTRGQITIAGGTVIKQDIVAAETRAAPGTASATAQILETVFTPIDGRAPTSPT